MCAGIAHCTPHDPRRSFSTITQRAGVDKYTVKDFGDWRMVGGVVGRKTLHWELDQVLRTAMDRIAGTA
jgi:hypothetical protein